MTITNRQPNCQPFKKNEKLKINKKKIKINMISF